MKGSKSWRLSRTLKRQVEVRPIEQEDVQYAWAAYKKGSLEAMGFATNLDAQKFKDAFEVYVLSNAATWTVLAKTAKDGFVPIGFVIGDWAPQGAFMMIVGISWFPWASRRNKVEGTVAFFNKIRKEIGWMGFANREHKPIYDVCCMHGIMNRVGTSLRTGQPIAVYEGR